MNTVIYEGDFEMVNEGFNILDKLFVQYTGKNIEVLEIPEGVVEIAASAFQRSNLDGCRKIIFPSSLRVINREALYRVNSKTLKELEFMGNIECIEAYAFAEVFSIENITFHGKVGKIKYSAFSHLVNVETIDFQKGVDTIGDYSFSGCRSLKKLLAPGLKRLGERALQDCHCLEILDIPNKVTFGEKPFTGCSKLKKTHMIIINNILFEHEMDQPIPEGVKTIAKNALSGNVMIPMSVCTIHSQNMGSIEFPEGFFCKDEPLSGEGILDAFDYIKLPIKDIAGLYLFQSKTQYDEYLKNQIGKNPGQFIKECIKLLATKGKSNNYLKAVEYVIKYLQAIPIISIQNLYEIGINKNYAKEAKLLSPYLTNDSSVSEDDAICAPFRKKYHEHLLDKVLNKYSFNGIRKVSLADHSGFAPRYLVKCAIAPYIESFKGRHVHISNYRNDTIRVKFIKGADEAASLLDRADLSKVCNNINLLKNPEVMLPFCRYADKDGINKLIGLISEWKDWNKYGAQGRSAIIVAHSALMLSDSREAMMYLDKKGFLQEVALLRKTDEDSLRDTLIADLGFDSNGKKYYNIGNKTIEVSIKNDFKFQLFDLETNKIVRSIPKKGCDIELHSKVSADLNDMKKNIKKVVSRRTEISFKDFLSGNGKPALSWMSSYLKNPVLNKFAQLLVWSQNGNTFTLSENGPIDCLGESYHIIEKDEICLAHPCEMNEEEVVNWKKYFLKNNLVQPFEQIWEPVRKPEQIKKTRYENYQISVFNFMNKQKHGIYFYNEDFNANIGFILDGCTLGFERTDISRHYIKDDETFTLKTFSFDKYSRKVNHIVSLLDRWTIYERILKDDPEIEEQLEEYTMAQISEFMKLASNNNCVKVLAVLMEYTHKNFSGFDPIYELSIDL